MDRIIKILNILWHGTKAILHLTNNKEKLDKMNEIEEQIKKK